jgi:hypothetical protein
VIGVGDIIVRKTGGAHFEVTKVLSGSWSGERYYDCKSMDDGREAFIYDDEAKLFLASQRQGKEGSK